MISEKGVMAREYSHTPDGKLVLTDQFWSDRDIEACFMPETITRAVLRRAQAVEKEVERLREALQDCQVLINNFNGPPGHLVGHLKNRIKEALATCDNGGDALPKAAGKQS